MATNAQLRKLARALDKSATLAVKHGDALTAAANTFDQVFGQEVGEEPGFLQSGNNFEKAFALFNNYAVHGDNMAGDTVDELVKEMNRLMTSDED